MLSNIHCAGPSEGLKIRGGGAVLFGGHNLPPLVEVGLSDLPKTGGPWHPRHSQGRQAYIKSQTSTLVTVICFTERNSWMISMLSALIRQWLRYSGSSEFRWKFSENSWEVRSTHCGLRKLTKTRTFGCLFFSSASMMLHPFRKLFRGAVWCSPKKGKKKSDMHTFQNQTLTLQKNRIQYENCLSFGKVRNFLRRSEFLNNSKIISLSYAFADRKILIPEGKGKWS